MVAPDASVSFAAVLPLSFAFCHAPVREVAYGSLLKEHRRFLHRSTAEAPDKERTPDTHDDTTSSPDVSTPFEPHEDDDTPLGDSDQHSDA